MMDLVDAGWLLRPCVYLLIWKETVVYVGQSRKPLSRLYTHASAARGAKGPAWLRARAVRFDGIRIYTCNAEDLLDVEAQLIAEYKPRYNIHHNDQRTVRVQRSRVRPPKIPVTLVVRGHRVTLNSPEPAKRSVQPLIVRRI
jgi:excinuclease UvrABC nuclease subunit